MTTRFVIRVFHKNGQSEFFHGWSPDVGNLFGQNIYLAYFCETYEHAQLVLGEITNTGVYQIEKVFLQD